MMNFWTGPDSTQRPRDFRQGATPSRESKLRRSCSLLKYLKFAMFVDRNAQKAIRISWRLRHHAVFGTFPDTTQQTFQLSFFSITRDVAFEFSLAGRRFITRSLYV